MEITIKFKTGAAFTWKNVKAREVESVAADIRELTTKDEGARAAFKKQGRLTGTKKPVRKVNKTK
jgi:hypothetical protein